jgi:hypothetical protein
MNEEEIQRVVALRLSSIPSGQIAEQLHVTRAEVDDAWRRWRDRNPLTPKEAAPEEELYRLEALRAHYYRESSQSAKALDIYLKLTDRVHAIYGIGLRSKQEIADDLLDLAASLEAARERVRKKRASAKVYSLPDSANANGTRPTN